MSLEYDIVIVGSGAGGGTVASRLASLSKSGARIAILDEGPYFPKEYLTQREVEMMDLFKNGGAWPVKDGTITMSTGKAVGGSTLMYTGVTFRLPYDVCMDWSVEGLTPEDLKPRFDRLEKEIHVIEPDEQMENDNNRLFKEACEKLGWPYEKIPLNIKNCEGMGFCNLGCAKGNKQGTLAVQIPEAEQAGIEIIPNCSVEKISKQTIHANIRKAPKGTKSGNYNSGKVEIKAKTIVLSAGTNGSPAILMRSGFHKELPAIGKYITLHPAMVVSGIYPESISNYKGFPKIYYTQAFSHSHDYYIETANYYPFITTKNLGLWGSDLKYVMKQYNHLMTVLLLAHDEALPENHIELDKNGEAQIDYKLSQKTIDSLIHSQIQAARIFKAAGCKELVIPCAKKMFFKSAEIDDKELEQFISSQYFIPNKTPVASAHLQGGCRMGNDPRTSVTDSWGRVHGHDWLYVADGSLFPKSSHVNPYLTIMALADRVAERIVEKAKSYKHPVSLL